MSYSVYMYTCVCVYVLGLVWIMTVFVDCLLYCTVMHSACLPACVRVYVCVNFEVLQVEVGD